MEKYYRFCGIELLFDLPAERMEYDELWLKPFAVSEVTDPHIYRFCIVPELTSLRGTVVMETPGSRICRDGDTTIQYLQLHGDARETIPYCIVSRGREHRVELPDCSSTKEIGVHFVLDCVDMLHLAAEAEGFVLHCSYVEHNGKAILFTFFLSIIIQHRPKFFAAQCFCLYQDMRKMQPKMRIHLLD